jgi:hypothetical protein
MPIPIRAERSSLMIKHLNGNDRQASRFSFSGHHYDAASGQVTLLYDVDGQLLTEVITFPWAPWPADASRQAAFFQALQVLHLVAGISYYKAGLAHSIELPACKVDASLAAFLNELYSQGLGEFAYVNELDLSDLTLFRANTDTTPAAMDLDLPERALVAMGGGKDSLVCLQMLKTAGIEVQPVCVGGSELIAATARAAGLPLIRIQRKLSPLLAEMNAAGAWNGHVPVTAINSAILLCASLLYGHRYIVFANESSANEATLTDSNGKEVNHQYSKSLVFEQAFRGVIHGRVSPNVEYFSLLRPYGEIAITRQFAEMTEYHAVFSSCNRNFHQDGPRIDGRWCQDCPKCRFAALALAPFLNPHQLIAIQGKDLLDQSDQLQGFKQLCGLGEDKPFECVGSIAESRAVVKHLVAQPGWQDKTVIRTLAEFDEIRLAGSLELYPDPHAEHCIPSSILAKLV